MDVEIKEKENQRHVGRNLQRIRVYLGMKQEALAGCRSWCKSADHFKD